MNSIIITETVQRTFNGSISFPESVRSLLEAGVEFYHIDYIRRQCHFYGAHSEVVLS